MEINVTAFFSTLPSFAFSNSLPLPFLLLLSSLGRVERIVERGDRKVERLEEKECGRKKREEKGEMREEGKETGQETGERREGS